MSWFALTVPCCCVLLHEQHEKFQSAPGSRVGTPAYLAPEVILTTRGKTYDGKVLCNTLHCLTSMVCLCAQRMPDDCCAC